MVTQKRAQGRQTMEAADVAAAGVDGFGDAEIAFGAGAAAAVAAPAAAAAAIAAAAEKTELKCWRWMVASSGGLGGAEPCL